MPNTSKMRRWLFSLLLMYRTPIFLLIVAYLYFVMSPAGADEGFVVTRSTARIYAGKEQVTLVLLLRILLSHQFLHQAFEYRLFRFLRRGNVIISFLCGALFLHEKNIKSKLIALAMVLIGLVFLYFGTR